MQSPASDDAAKILDNLRQIVRALRVTAHSVERDHGISGAQLFVLRELSVEPGCSIRRVAERTLTDASSVSVVVSRLVERKLVLRRRDRNDARRSTLTLTAAGQRLLGRASTPFQARLASALCKLSRPRLRRLNADLTWVVQQAGASKGKAPMFFDESGSKAGRLGN